MKKIKNILFDNGAATSYLYFYVHFIVEIVCFFSLARVFGDSIILWLVPFMYDALAFVPQSMIGYVSDKFPKINMGLIGVLLLLIGFITFNCGLFSYYLPLIALTLGNAFLHVDGAEVTLRCANGRLSLSSIFVAGGSFGVITGKLIGSTNLPYIILAPIILTIIPFVLLGHSYLEETSKDSCKKFNYANPKMNPWSIILLTVLVVIVRGYMGYGIPTSWNKTVIQNIIFYCAMGIGKALGGIFSDFFGIRKIAFISTIVALPFLLIGDNLMVVSLIGVAFFSMTMAITLAILVSVLKESPGLAFGHTTIGLFLGTAPIFFFRITDTILNAAVIIILTILCVIILSKVLRKDELNE